MTGAPAPETLRDLLRPCPYMTRALCRRLCAEARRSTRSRRPCAPPRPGARDCRGFWRRRTAGPRLGRALGKRLALLPAALGDHLSARWPTICRFAGPATAALAHGYDANSTRREHCGPGAQGHRADGSGAGGRTGIRSLKIRHNQCAGYYIAGDGHHREIIDRRR